MTMLPGSTGKIVWSFDDDLSVVFSRSWAFTSTDGSFSNTVLTRIAADGAATIFFSFPVITVEKPATLVLKNVNRSYDGKYKFTLQARSDTSSEVTVFIAEKPNVILSCPSLVTLDEGDNFTCHCNSTGGNPPAKVIWYKDGNYTGFKKDNQTLKISNISRAESGTYTCNATSYPHENYTDEKSFVVIVNFKPTKTVIKFSQNPAVIDESVTITCTSEGSPQPSYTIYHNGTKVSSTCYPYSIPKLKWKDAGRYNCIASNLLGNDSDSDFFYIEEPKPTMQSIGSTASMKTNPLFSSIPICTTTCTNTCAPTTTTTQVPLTGDGTEKKQNCSGNNGTDWYIVAVTLVSGIIFGIILSYIVFRVRSKNRNRQLSNPEPVPPTSRVDQTYQELDLAKLNKEDNYQSLRGNAARNYGVNDESNYTELNKSREVENNYQSLTRN
ncbi:hemicentin-1-like [Dendronephthya gigantea]|uniref:hemicentin-1-like n=1 Tax=Dendronephthya gigantea TaxID=151771 RepID=UPI001069E741|nr:hemicentin-1-like [Dendronephthya gigantea]